MEGLLLVQVLFQRFHDERLFLGRADVGAGAAAVQSSGEMVTEKAYCSQPLPFIWADFRAAGAEAFSCAFSTKGRMTACGQT